MAYPETEVLDWTAAILDTEVTVVRGLRRGSSPWLLQAGYREVGWFPMEMAGQGRPDLTREVMLERRDAFLDAALSRLSVNR